jgi:hypothetical protein
MAYHIKKIINNSSKSVVLTNPVAERDTHLVTKNSSLRLGHSPLVPRINESNISYETAVTKALNIYTMKNNWCFWDNGSRTALVGLEDGGKSKGFSTHSVPNLELIIDENGTPSIGWYQLSLGFKMQKQADSNWCWAAVTASVANYYIGKDTWKQCELANLAFNRKDCCNSSSCNKDLPLERALYLTRNVREFRAQVLFEDIIKEIDDGRPIPIQLVPWKGDLAHMIVITGYDNDYPDKPKIEIQDPNYYFNPKSVCDFNTFPDSYGWFPKSSWSGSCLTKPS